MNVCQNPCKHGATCNDKVNDYRCTCAPGYKGKNCEIDINECLPNPCKHGATCNDKVNDYRCTCAPGYKGKNCEIDINECLPNPCKHGATCKDKVNDYSCTCPPGYKGKNCEIDIDECLPNPCKHGAICKDRVNGYRCMCAPGYKGKNCEKDINECLSNPCKHGATCNDKVNDYRCTCPPGYNGKNCEIGIINTEVIIVISCGSGFFLALVCGVVCFVIHRKCKKANITRNVEIGRNTDNRAALENRNVEMSRHISTERGGDHEYADINELEMSDFVASPSEQPALSDDDNSSESSNGIRLISDGYLNPYQALLPAPQHPENIHEESNENSDTLEENRTYTNLYEPLESNRREESHIYARCISEQSLEIKDEPI
ncbi:Hypothetical predicted protein [Mytilus galloprovincialis]|uniref:EGF-like domain-containing protein n=1 Tax=Mytilus galloprovincialis TaxID=29158 RepID=A0A8B6DY28_MYTGA|nr:Hypothetical predicted protein [Mytilus galloprovincialis]